MLDPGHILVKYSYFGDIYSNIGDNLFSIFFIDTLQRDSGGQESGQN